MLDTELRSPSGGRYSVKRQLSECVYEAVVVAVSPGVALSAGNVVAVKFVGNKAEKRQEPRFLERLAIARPSASHLPNAIDGVHQQHQQQLWGILDMYEAFEKDVMLILILEYCEKDLYSLIIATNHGLPHPLVRVIFTRAANALEHCHRRGIYHRDIKPENILIKDNDANNPIIRLADFGLATDRALLPPNSAGSIRYLPPEACAPTTHPHVMLAQQRLSSPSPSLKSGSSAGTSASIGRASYYSPEAADIWALTIVLLNLLFAAHPWPSPWDPTCQLYLTSQDPYFFRRTFNVSSAFDALLRRVFDVDFRRRIRAVGGVRGLRDLVLSLPNFVDTPDLLSMGVSDSDGSSGPDDDDDDDGVYHTAVRQSVTPGHVAVLSALDPLNAASAGGSQRSSGPGSAAGMLSAPSSPRPIIHNGIVTPPPSHVTSFGARSSSIHHLHNMQRQQSVQAPPARGGGQPHQHHFAVLSAPVVLQQSWDAAISDVATLTATSGTGVFTPRGATSNDDVRRW